MVYTPPPEDPPEVQAEIDRVLAEYFAYMHAIQSGVAMMMNYTESETEPKHLRVGVASALLANGALCDLLVRKGILTKIEVCEAIRDYAEREKRMYEERISDIVGQRVTLA